MFRLTQNVQVKCCRSAALQRLGAGNFLIVLLWLSTGCGLENRLIFHPTTAIARTPRDVGLDYLDLYFTTADNVRLNGWFIPHPQASATMIWFHGNAGNIGDRVDNIQLLHDKTRISIFIFDYRGYGRSPGSSSETTTYLDGDAAMNFVRTHLQVESKNLLIFGRSLGAAVAAEMATRHGSRAVILESPFASISDMAKIVLPALPIGPLLSAKFDVIDKVGKITAPLLVLHGDQDEIIPFEQGQRVFAAARQPKQFYPIKGAGHNDTFIAGGDGYYERLKSFIETSR
ncbi:MAG: alpha/beta hydrolase [Candidatus Binatia bacterium]